MYLRSSRHLGGNEIARQLLHADISIGARTHAERDERAAVVEEQARGVDEGGHYAKQFTTHEGAAVVQQCVQSTQRW